MTAVVVAFFAGVLLWGALIFGGLAIMRRRRRRRQLSDGDDVQSWLDQNRDAWERAHVTLYVDSDGVLRCRPK